MNERFTSHELAPALTAVETEQMIIKNLPPIDHHGEKVERVGHDAIRVRLPYNSAFRGPSHGRTAADRCFQARW